MSYISVKNSHKTKKMNGVVAQTDIELNVINKQIYVWYFFIKKNSYFLNLKSNNTYLPSTNLPITRQPAWPIGPF